MFIRFLLDFIANLEKLFHCLLFVFSFVCLMGKGSPYTWEIWTHQALRVAGCITKKSMRIFPWGHDFSWAVHSSHSIRERWKKVHVTHGDSFYQVLNIHSIHTHLNIKCWFPFNSWEILIFILFFLEEGKRASFSNTPQVRSEK